MRGLPNKVVPMNQRDLELLDRQFAWLQPSRRRSNARLRSPVVILLAGLCVGGSLVLHNASSDQAAATGTSPTVLAFSAVPRG